ncbi:MAG: riboflavin synthase, partial [Firmicutes bacterium HGW-Firmicutes-13]
MFTGIVEELGVIKSLEVKSNNPAVEIKAVEILS